MNYAGLTDAQLLEIIYQGDNSAFTFVYQSHWKELIPHAIRMAQDEELAKDLVQDVFMVLLDKKTKLKEGQTIIQFLFTCMRNKITNHFRRTKVQGKYLKHLSSLFENEHAALDSDLLGKQLSVLIQKEIDHMPPRMREILALCWEGYLSNKEIAEQLKTTEDNVRRQRSYGIQRLKVVAKQYFFFGITFSMVILQKISNFFS